MNNKNAEIEDVYTVIWLYCGLLCLKTHTHTHAKQVTLLIPLTTPFLNTGPFLIGRTVDESGVHCCGS